MCTALALISHVTCRPMYEVKEGTMQVGKKNAWVHGCGSIVYWMQVWILVGSMDLAGPVATLFLAASFIRTQQLGRCTLSRTVGPPLHICACRNHLRTTQASMLHGVEWICLIFDSFFFAMMPYNCNKPMCILVI